MNLTKVFKLPNMLLTRNICTISRNISARNNSVLHLNSLITKEMPNRRHVSNSPQPEAKINDLTQALVSFKYLRLIKKAIREFGPIVEENKKLQALLQKAQEYNIPSDYINFITRISVDPRATVGLMEMLFFSNCHFIVQYEDVDNAPTKHHLLTMCEGSDAQLIHNNLKWPKNFDQKGIISVRKDNSSLPFNNPKEAKKAIPAQSVTEVFDPEGISFWQFCCDPSDLHKVKRYLTEKNCEIEEAFVGYIPKREIMIPNNVRNAARKLVVDLSKIPTIDNVYTNIM